jgi:hypothetical protein
MRTEFKEYGGSNVIAALNTAESFLVPLITALPEGAKVFVVETEIDALDNANFDNDLCAVECIMKKGDHKANVAPFVREDGVLRGTHLQITREAAGVFRSRGSRVHKQAVKKFAEVPVVSGVANLTMTIAPTGFTALKPTVAYNVGFIVEFQD